MQVNPIIEKEIKTKMRGWKSPTLLTVYLLLLGVVVYLLFLSFGYGGRYGMPSFQPRTAVTIYVVLASFQFSLLMMIIPAITATSISGERERQTLDLMLCTDMKPVRILIGKMIVSVSHIMLLVFASFPLMAIVLMFGGITLGDIIKLYLFYALTALMISSVGTFFSTLFKKNIAAIIMTYIVLLFFTVGTLIMFLIYFSITSMSGIQQPSYGIVAAFLFSNPTFGFLSFVGGNGGFFGNAYYSLIRSGTATSWIDNFQPWMLNAFFDVIVIVLLTWLSSMKLKKG